jgi:hypothetical protein
MRPIILINDVGCNGRAIHGIHALCKTASF